MSGKPAPHKVVWEKAVLRGSGLPLPAIGVVMALASYGDADGSNVRPTQERLADDLGCNVRTVRKWLDLAEESGWIKKTREGRSGLASLYLLTIPNRNERAGSSEGAGEPRRSVRSGSSTAGREISRNDRSGSTGLDLPTGTIAQANRNERSGCNRNERSPYQHITNSTTNTSTALQVEAKLPALFARPSQFPDNFEDFIPSEDEDPWAVAMQATP
ncbi:helix-turn-helix domain-containing protein [Micromonospora mirobrigensis]|uniref:Helix-turn-helix domain-containing protein n=1 Tax=Micromonospora mirobrigensis TaxID=262898 RepID=A0A1C5AIU3_9ACTN|nr:helix-turn-helix domain-containing protein [Micromonospora mirobrigensis]SCF45001.1 Helix-turn-helix domain-containing protein [Micromonospora mirobrigensis]